MFIKDKQNEYYDNHLVASNFLQRQQQETFGAKDNLPWLGGFPFQAIEQNISIADQARINNIFTLSKGGAGLLNSVLDLLIIVIGPTDCEINDKRNIFEV